MNPTNTILAAAALIVAGPSPDLRAAITLFESAGANPAAIQPTVDSFRATLGSLNPNNGGTFASGRREINWDGVPDGASDPNAFPGDFFASVVPGGRARGIEFSTPGTGFLVSADSSNPTATPTLFGFPFDFATFSAERLFTPIGSTITDITFFEAGTTTPASVDGFGAVFVDVEVAGTTLLEGFDFDGNLLFTRSVLPAGNAGFSFLGIFANAGEQIARIRLDTGDNALLGNGLLSDPNNDAVVLDDFIYAEPQAVVPEANTSLATFGMAALAASCLIRRRARAKSQA